MAIQKKNILLYGFLLALILIAMYNAVYMKRPTDSAISTQENKKVFPNLPIKDIDTIEFTDYFGEITLKKRGEDWYISERDYHPAYAARINEVLLALASLKATQEIEAPKDKWGSMALRDPDTHKIQEEVGSKIVLSGGNYSVSILAGYLDKSKSEASMVFGDDFDGRQVIRLLSNDKIYMTNASLRFSNTIIGNWISPNWVGSYHNLEVAYYVDGNLQWKALRDSINTPFTLLQDAESDGSKVHRLNSLSQKIDYALATVLIRDVVLKDFPAGKTGLNRGHYFLVTTDAGELYKLNLGKKVKVPKQVQELFEDTRGIMRSVSASSWRYINVEWPKGNPKPELPPFTDKRYLIEAGLLDSILINRRELLVFERMRQQNQ